MVILNLFLMPKSGESGPEIITRLKRDLLPTLLAGALFWPACDFVLFKFIPVHLQVYIHLDEMSLYELNFLK